MKLTVAAGVPLIVRPDFWIIPVLLFLFGVSNHAIEPAFVPIATAIVFLSVLVHEVAHALVGAKYGAPAIRIEIWLLGGLAVFPRLPMLRRHQALLLVAGPLSNCAIAAVCFAVWFVVPAALPGIGKTMWAAALFNAYLGLGNLLPALPLDGGRLLFLALQKWTSVRLAIKVVGLVGLVLFPFAALAGFSFIMSGFPFFPPVDPRISLRALRRGNFIQRVT